MSLTRDELLKIRENLNRAFSMYQPTDKMMRTAIGREIAAEYREKQSEIRQLFAAVEREIREIDVAESQKRTRRRAKEAPTA